MISKFVFCLSQSFLLVFLNVSISYAQETLSKEEQVEKYYNQAIDYHNAGEYDKALEYYTKVIELDSSNVNSYWYRALIYDVKEDYNNAVNDLKIVNTLAPAFATAYGNLGWYLILLNRLDEAIVPTERVITMETDSTQFAWLTNYGHIFLLKGDTITANRYYDKVIQLIFSSHTFYELNDGPIADLELFIENGWQADLCKKEIDRILIKYDYYIEEGKLTYTARQSWEDLSKKVIQYYNEGDYVTAISYAEEALKQCEIGYGKDHQNYGISQLVLAKLYQDMRQYKEALPLYLAAKENAEKNLDKGDLEYGNILYKISGLYESLGQYEKAIPFCIEALENTKKNLGENNSNYCTRLANLASLYQDMNRYEEALSLYLEALKNIEKNYGKSHPDYGVLSNNLAKLYEGMQRYKEALPLYIQALENNEKNLGKNHLNYGAILSNLAGLYESMGQYENALPLSIEALKNTEKNLGKDHSKYGSRVNNLAGLYKDMGHYEEALPFYLEALSNIEKNLGKEHPDYGTCSNNLAVLYTEMGRYEEALPLNLEALENAVINVGKDYPDYGNRLNNLGGLYTEMGRYEEALSLYLGALKITEKNLGKDHPDYGMCLSNLGALYAKMNRYEEALPLSLEALKNTEKNFGKNHPDYGFRMNNLAALYDKAGLYEEAYSLYQQALEITEKNLGKNHSQYGTFLSSFALLNLKMNRYKEALPLSLTALKNAEKNLGMDHPDYVRRLSNLAGSYMVIGRNEEALPLYLQANRGLHKQIKNIFSFSSEKEKKAFFNTLSSQFKLYQSFHYKTSSQFNEMSEMLYNDQLILKGLLLTSSKNMLYAIRESGGKETTKLYNQWIGIKRRLAAEYSKPIKKRVSNLDSLEAEANKIEGQLASLSKQFNKEKQKEEITWKEVQKRLGAGDIAIEFANFRYFGNDSTFYAAYVLTTESEYPMTVYLFEENELNELLKNRSPNKLYAFRGAELISTKETEYSGEDLYRLIIKPLEKHLEGKERIYFSTDGKLHQFSFAAFSTGEGELLCDKYELVQLNSTGQIVLGDKIPEKEPVVLVGGIEYEYVIDQNATKDIEKNYAYNYLEDKTIQLSRSNNERGSDWNYLPGTRAEVEKLIQIFEENRLSADTLTGIYATEESIKKLDGNSPSVLHIATHGFFFENPERKDKDKEMLSFNEKQSYIISEDPLMRTGLVLAGGNYAWKNGSNPYESEDGILTAYEISNLNLLKTDLVVLSACETGLGDIEGSEGVYGLQRAFRMAGVENIIMSLWQVPDKETVEFMETFYRNWLSGEQIREAFNNTQKVMSKKYIEEPEKWAAFVLLE